MSAKYTRLGQLDEKFVVPSRYLRPSYASVYAIVWGPHLIGIKVKTAKGYAWLDFYYTCICLLRKLPDGAK